MFVASIRTERFGFLNLEPLAEDCRQRSTFPASRSRSDRGCRAFRAVGFCRTMLPDASVIALSVHTDPQAGGDRARIGIVIFLYASPK